MIVYLYIISYTTICQSSNFSENLMRLPSHQYRQPTSRLSDLGKLCDSRSQVQHSQITDFATGILNTRWTMHDAAGTSLHLVSLCVVKRFRVRVRLPRCQDALLKNIYVCKHTIKQIHMSDICFCKCNHCRDALWIILFTAEWTVLCEFHVASLSVHLLPTVVGCVGPAQGVAQAEVAIQTMMSHMQSQNYT